MSFGFSVGDFLAVGQLAWQVYRKCKTAPSEFKSVSSQLVSLHIVIKDVHATIEEWELPEAKKDDLLQIVGDAKETLEELDQLLQKYKRLGLKSSRTFDRLRYPRAEVDELRIRVESSINMLTSFKTGLVLSSQARLEKMVSQLMSERQQGLREASIISHQSIAAAEDGDDDVWLDIKRELEDFGTVTDEFLNEQRGYIIDLLKSALAGDDESQSPITDSNVSGDQYAAGSHSPLQNSYEIVATMNDIALTEDKYLSELRSVKGADDDISGYLIDDLYNALSFYEMFCQGSTIGSNTLQMDLSLKLFHLGRGIRVIQSLSLANPEYWKKALTETIRAAEEALLLTEDIIELWLFNQNTNGLWEAGTTHLARLECPTSLTIVESDDPVVEKNILTLKDNFHVVRAAMEVDSGSLLLHRIMHQQIIACQFSLLVLQCESLWSYAQMVPYSKSKGGTLKYSYDINQEHLRKRSDMLIAQTNLLQATVSHHSRLASICNMPMFDYID
ncbi:hypothetical protein B0O99DRAFT_593060 [Bisporella sp. PMI_857]|nr:hypothetical protein B0O99DRAFT_593060 [Bisporella sp. PMI_857]